MFASRLLRTLGIAAVVICFCVTPSLADDDAKKRDEKSLTSDDVVKLGMALQPSFCHVEVWLRYDKGQAPHGLTTSEYSGFDSQIADHRPMLRAGFVLAADQVMIRDFELELRFVEKIHVIQGDSRVSASVCGYAHNYAATFLKLERPLPDAKPLAFDKDAKGPYLAAWYGESDAEWVTTVGSTLQRVTLRPTGPVASTWSEAVIITKTGTPVGMSARGELPLDGSWKGSPLGWKRHDTASAEGLASATEAIANRGLVRVKLRFRSPKATEGSGNPWEMMMGGEDEGDTETERDATGVLFGDTEILVLETIEPKTTARLEAIEIHVPDREMVEAEFVATLKDYGALVARVEAPLPGAVVATTQMIREYMYQLLLGAHIEVHGEQRDVHVGHYRFASVSRSWRDQIMPSFDGPASGYYVFDTTGALIAVPVERRRPGQTDRWDREGSVTLPFAYLQPVLADLPNHIDANNVPVSEEEEGRIAWFGVEVQPLDRDLARINEVSHLTDDGESGAIVSYVYPDSPAAKGGIEPGTILLRVHVPDRPQPIPVVGGDDHGLGDMWGALRDQIPEEMWGEMPGFTPWGSANNWINKTLTEIGFGKPFSLEMFVNGEVKTTPFTIEKGPAHFEAAPQVKSEALGLTVKDLTYEVRRYYQLAPDAPGVIVAKTESGEPAAVAGVKPFEIVTEVSGQTITSVKDFENAIAAGGELQWKLKNRLRERVVKVKPAANGGGEDGD